MAVLLSVIVVVLLAITAIVWFVILPNAYKVGDKVVTKWEEKTSIEKKKEEEKNV